MVLNLPVSEWILKYDIWRHCWFLGWMNRFSNNFGQKNWILDHCARVSSCFDYANLLTELFQIWCLDFVWQIIDYTGSCFLINLYIPRPPNIRYFNNIGETFCTPNCTKYLHNVYQNLINFSVCDQILAMYVNLVKIG